MDLAFLYAETNPLETASDYPYTGTQGECATHGKGLVKATIYKDVVPNDNAQMKAALAFGPVSIAIEADTTAFQGYIGGVLNS